MNQKKPARPNKNDLRQLEFLVRKGVGQDYIMNLLDISPAQFDKWKKHTKASSILALIPEKTPEKFTIYHPSIEGQTEVAFEVNMVKFYRFKDEYRHPTGRYKYVYKCLKEMELSMNRETLAEYVKQLKNILNGGSKGQAINMGEAWRLLHNMETRTTLPFDPGMVKRLASVVYFTDDEDISTYDQSYGDFKIKLWDDNNVHDFFLTRPIAELLNLNNTSLESLEEYLTTAKGILEELTLEPQIQSLENS